MQSWERVAFMNRYLAGTLAPRLQLDLIPGLRCAAHFAIVAPRPPQPWMIICRRVARCSGCG
ncbi:hypothetical protein ACFQDL_01750 [Marinobacterium aestuariivivens]|uniref:Uncharacterized protein n=2 Tax=Marinobacterium aestuariivivens TaxID=1698799 RepID=A0ABW1ZT94_9GAMM